MECYLIEGKASSEIGMTKLEAYFSEKYGFIRLEYELLNDVKVNLWLIDILKGQTFRDLKTLYSSKSKQ
jgi:hypothetical protein